MFNGDGWLFVVCFEHGMGPYGGSDGNDGVTLQVVGDDGRLWGQPLQLVLELRNIGGVDCGWNGRDIVVLWWSAALPQNEIWSQRARPTFL